MKHRSLCSLVLCTVVLCFTACDEQSITKTPDCQLQATVIDATEVSPIGFITVEAIDALNAGLGSGALELAWPGGTSTTTLGVTMDSPPGTVEFVEATLAEWVQVDKERCVSHLDFADTVELSAADGALDDTLSSQIQVFEDGRATITVDEFDADQLQGDLDLAGYFPVDPVGYALDDYDNVNIVVELTIDDVQTAGQLSGNAWRTDSDGEGIEVDTFVIGTIAGPGVSLEP